LRGEARIEAEILKSEKDFEAKGDWIEN